MKLDVLRNYKLESQVYVESETAEKDFVRKLFCVVLCYYTYSFKGGWQNLEETANFLLMHSEKVCFPCWYIICYFQKSDTRVLKLCFLFLQNNISYRYFLRDIYEDLVRRLLELSSEENIFLSQPCRDNTLYLLKLIDEFLISEIDGRLPVFRIPVFTCI